MDRHCLVDIVRCHCQSVKLKTDCHCISCAASGCGRGGAGDGCVHRWLLDNACGLHECMRGEGRGGQKSGEKGTQEEKGRGKSVYYSIVQQIGRSLSD